MTPRVKAAYLAAMMSFGLLAGSAAQAVPIVTIEPSSQSVHRAESVSVDIVVLDVVDLFAFQFDLRFDPAILFTSAISEGGFLAAGGPTLFIPGVIDNSAGSITLTAGTLLGPGSGVDGSGTLATVTFVAFGVGTSVLDLSNVVLLDSSLLQVFAGSANAAITVVPEPSSLLLLGLGLAGLGLSRRRNT